MKRRIQYRLITLVGVLLLLASSCKKDTVDTGSITISDDTFYKELGITIINCYRDIYNQNLAGKPTGNQNITANGPMGGTVVITGSDSYDATHGITTVNLVLTMTSVKYTYTDPSKKWVTEVTLTGATTYSGSFSDTYTSVNHQSTSLFIKGSVTYDGTTRIIDSYGAVSINRSTTTSVTIFGNTVTW